MRSAVPIPGNPWPHDMQITVEDRPQHLRELLWLREAHGLHLEGDDLPPRLAETPEPATIPVDDATRALWEGAWVRIWRAVAAHAAREHAPQLFDQLQGTQAGSPQREALLREVVGPDWGDEFDRDVFQDPSHLDWDQASMAAFAASRPHALENSPERRDLDALIRAWRAGLTKIITIPCQGEYTRKVGPHALLMTDAARADSDGYRRALATFN
ncbi:hypothetical protein J2X03_002956 [Microbacterium trichothecenolyticum]|uniref:hypothetical protein n=1 Tax=Microbacterium trichothecenolyticum TaxID=69370 RepID=UPI0028624E32|nr:hypothetical protein [Microbacterium trichothecenolyticum]MDR7113059.1 hypothetical protein [Microbacterium trichothecenolyticum]